MPESTTAIVQAFATGCCGMTEIAQTFEIHYATVGRIVKMTDNFWEMGDLTPLPLCRVQTEPNKSSQHPRVSIA